MGNYSNICATHGLPNCMSLLCDPDAGQRLVDTHHAATAAHDALIESTKALLADPPLDAPTYGGEEVCQHHLPRGRCCSVFCQPYTPTREGNAARAALKKRVRELTAEQRADPDSVCVHGYFALRCHAAHCRDKWIAAASNKANDEKIRERNTAELEHFGTLDRLGWRK